MKQKLLVIAGPTAVGKTELSIRLAKELNGEIISADSMQIYNHIDRPLINQKYLLRKVVSF